MDTNQPTSVTVSVFYFFNDQHIQAILLGNDSNGDLANFGPEGLPSGSQIEVQTGKLNYFLQIVGNPNPVQQTSLFEIENDTKSISFKIGNYLKIATSDNQPILNFDTVPLETI